MKFIRDIINEKKQVAGAGHQAAAVPPVPQNPAGADMAAERPEALVLDDSHAVPAQEDEHFSLFDDGQVIEGSAEPAESLFAEPEDMSVAPRLDTGGATVDEFDDDFDEEDAESYSEAVLHPAAPAETPVEIPDDDLSQHLLSRVPGAEADATDIGAPVSVPAPAAGRGSRRAARVKTRLLGFGSAQEVVSDPLASAPRQAANSSGTFPVGWLVVTDGPGRGASFTLFEGVSQIGRGEDQAVRLDFGDTSISRSNHAAVAYDPEQKAFFLGHGGKANLVRLNGRPVLSTETMASGDQIRIGETSLRLAALCGDGFDWSEDSDAGEPRVSHG